MLAFLLRSRSSSLTLPRLCLSLLLLSNGLSFLHLSSISPVCAHEEEEYSNMVANLLPQSFKKYFTWTTANDQTTAVAAVTTTTDDGAQPSLPGNTVDKPVPGVITYDTIDPLISSKADAIVPANGLIQEAILEDEEEEEETRRTPPPTPTPTASPLVDSQVTGKARKGHKHPGYPKTFFPTGSKDNRICHSCGKNEVFADEDEEHRQRLEYIKEQILTRLGMKRPPKLRIQPDIDLSMYMRIAENTKSMNQREMSEFAEPEEEVDKVFVLPSLSAEGNGATKAPIFDMSTVDTENSTKHMEAITILVSYNLTENYYTSASLTDDTDLLITSVPDEEANDVHSRSLELLSTVAPMKQSQERSTTTGEEGAAFESSHWYQYDVTSLLTDYPSKIQLHNRNFDILGSVIVIEMTNHKQSRHKRSLDCQDKSSFCCRQEFYVNFTTIGWNNWIFQPAGYNANYCKGKCDLSHARYHHTTVIGKYPAIKLCCSPREMSSISLIYMDDKFNIYQKNLPNMVVKSCDCA